MRTKTLLPYAAGLAAALVLGGCAAGEPPPAGAATAATTSRRLPTGAPASSSATTTTTADPVLARIPKAARENTQEGAEAFAQFFIEQVARSFVDADPKLLSGLYTKDCKTCANFRKTAANFQADREHHSKPSFLVQDTGIRRFLDGEPSKFIEVSGREVKVDIVDHADSPVGATHAKEGVRFVLVMEFDRHWSVSAVHVEQS